MTSDISLYHQFKYYIFIMYSKDCNCNFFRYYYFLIFRIVTFEIKFSGCKIIIFKVRSGSFINLPYKSLSILSFTRYFYRYCYLLIFQTVIFKTWGNRLVNLPSKLSLNFSHLHYLSIIDATQPAYFFSLVKYCIFTVF